MYKIFCVLLATSIGAAPCFEYFGGGSKPSKGWSITRTYISCYPEVFQIRPALRERSIENDYWITKESYSAARGNARIPLVLSRDKLSLTLDVRILNCATFPPYKFITREMNKCVRLSEFLTKLIANATSTLRIDMANCNLILDIGGARVIIHMSTDKPSDADHITRALRHGGDQSSEIIRWISTILKNVLDTIEEGTPDPEPLTLPPAAVVVPYTP